MLGLKALVTCSIARTHRPSENVLRDNLVFAPGKNQEQKGTVRTGTLVCWYAGTPVCRYAGYCMLVYMLVYAGIRWYARCGRRVAHEAALTRS
jgi:hypothetical protein